MTQTKKIGIWQLLFLFSLISLSIGVLNYQVRQYDTNTEVEASLELEKNEVLICNQILNEKQFTDKDSNFMSLEGYSEKKEYETTRTKIIKLLKNS